MDRRLVTVEELSAIEGVRFEGLPLDLHVTGVSIDSRTLKEGDLFFALEGERSDGHRFLPAAFEAGAAAAVVRRDYWEGFPAEIREAGSFVLVADPLAALQELARIYLRRFPELRTIAVTGSNGKTTTKEFIAAILSRETPTYFSAGNFNSEIGLPLAVFGLTGEHRLGVFELATNRVGEIELLADILRPDIALITNIGSAHIGMFGSREAIADEKGAVFTFFNESSLGLIWENDPYASRLTAGRKGHFSTFGPTSTPGVENIEHGGIAGGIITYRGEEIRCALPGRHNLLNACAAISVAQACGVSDEAIRRGIEAVAPSFGRSQFIPGEISILQDCYNANLESLEAGIAALAGFGWTKGRTIGVMGSMMELGEQTEQIHQEAGAVCAASGFDAWFFFGTEAEASFRNYTRKTALPGFWETGFELVAEAVKSYLRRGDLLYLKASRSMGLERLSEQITGTGAGRQAC